jgi:glutathione S-transferase
VLIRANVGFGAVVAQVPYLIDPNTGVEMFESAEIVEYLEKTYSL